MDPLSAGASVIAVVQLSTEIIKYLYHVKNAPTDCERFLKEASNLSSLLFTLTSRLQEGQSNHVWYQEVNSLGAQGGPLDQYRHTLEKLLLKVQSKNGLSRIGSSLVWKFNKEEVAGILSTIERLKSLIQIALEMDHL